MQVNRNPYSFTVEIREKCGRRHQRHADTGKMTMVCTHLRELSTLCEQHEIRPGSADLIRLVCKQCDEDEACPSTFMDEYDARHPQETQATGTTDELVKDDAQC
jgi:hypothetical protein